tara:strand:- start:345 stop:518 length:174 start_codon:yes stop_codon:yes gene_type:complete
MIMAFKDYVRFDLIENGKVKHYYKIIYQDKYALVYNNFKIIKIYNNKIGVQANEYNI